MGRLISSHAQVRSRARFCARRPGSPQLQRVLYEFYTDYLEHEAVLAYRLKQYMAHIKQIEHTTGTAEWERLEQTLALFNKMASSTASIRSCWPCMNARIMLTHCLRFSRGVSDFLVTLPILHCVHLA